MIGTQGVLFFRYSLDTRGDAFWRPNGEAFGFLAVAVLLIVITGLATKLNRIVLGGGKPQPAALYLGLFGIGVIVIVNGLANWAA